MNAFTDTPTMVNWNTTIATDLAVLQAIIDGYRVTLMIEHPLALAEIDSLINKLKTQLQQSPFLAEESAQEILIQMLQVTIGQIHSLEFRIIRHQIERLRRVIFDVGEVFRSALASSSQQYSKL